MSHVASGSPRAIALVPTWNAESFIDATLATLAAQTFPAFEVLISDDASTDATASICERWAARDARFRLLRQNTRLGWVGNTNALLRAARGDYFFFALHDDLVAPTYVARLVDALERDPAAVLAFSDGERLKRDRAAEYWSFAELDGLSGRLEGPITLARQRPNWPVCYRGLFRASAAERIGGLRRNLAGEFGADWPWLLHMSLLGSFVRVPERLFTKVLRPDGLANSWRYSAWDWFAATLSCAGEVRRAALPLRDESRLHAQLCRTSARLVVAACRQRLARNPLVRRVRARIDPGGRGVPQSKSRRRS